MATLTRLLLALHGLEGPEWFQAGDSLIKPGYVVVRDDHDEVKISPTTPEQPLGVAGCTSYHDLNTVYNAGADGERVPVWLCGSGVDIYVLHDDDTGATTLVRPSYFWQDDANAGAVRLWAYTDAAIGTDTLAYVVGKLIGGDVVISGDTPTFIKIKLSL
jgi:hypothetical protein